jgi:hypothetical protein
VKSNLTNEELSAQLRDAQRALYRCQLFAAVAHDARDAMHEASGPLEVLANLHYLTRHTNHDPAKVIEYMAEAEAQSLRLLEIVRRVVRAHNAAITEADGIGGQFVM